jgi:hypothetical protein
MRMHTMLEKALTGTAEHWPPLRAIFDWIGQAAQILDNPHLASGVTVEAQYQALLAQLAALRITPAGDAIRGWGEHFLKITRSYWGGLFHCDEVVDVPRTNHDLEPFFGKLRHHERRGTGRKVVAPSLIVRGAVRVLAAVVSWIRPLTVLQLSQIDVVAWQEDRRQLKQLRQARVLQRRFRQHPEPYLAALEERLVKLNLPP